MDFAGREGFSQVLIRVPPPTDTDAHLFSPRSAEVQLKASQHLAQWYHRLMEYGMRIGTVSEYQCSTDGEDIAFPLTILSARDASAEVHFKKICDTLEKSEPGGVHHYSHIACADRYFVATLRPPEEALARGAGGVQDNMGCNQPLIVCPLAANRHRFMSFCGQKRLFFHSIEHAQFSTMILMQQFLQQRQATDGSPPTEEELDEQWECHTLTSDTELERVREREHMALSQRVQQKQRDHHGMLEQQGAPQSYAHDDGGEGAEDGKVDDLSSLEAFGVGAPEDSLTEGSEMDRHCRPSPMAVGPPGRDGREEAL
jgi:hypothetical protein